uniref:Uncharacterized protein n=1 Tax=Oryza brachyantha TaxID=4533 RepID=J3NC22_ORYBR
MNNVVPSCKSRFESLPSAFCVTPSTSTALHFSCIICLSDITWWPARSSLQTTLTTKPHSKMKHHKHGEQYTISLLSRILMRLILVPLFSIRTITINSAATWLRSNRVKQSFQFKPFNGSCLIFP